MFSQDNGQGQQKSLAVPKSWIWPFEQQLGQAILWGVALDRSNLFVNSKFSFETSEKLVKT
jgi:hypothetical protein